MAKDVPIIGRQRELHAKHLFLVELSPDISAGFQKCSELSAEAAKIEYHEGGSIIPWKIPGRMTFTDITLERGTSTSRAFYDWFIQVGNASIVQDKLTRGMGYKTPLYMKDIDVIQLDRDGYTALKIWRCFQAWPQKFVAGDWDNAADEVVIEQLVITFDYFELV